jgi:type II secretory pathway component PulL
MDIPNGLLEVGQYFDDGYKPVLDFHGWRVAMLRYGEFVTAKHLHQVERHRNTNEVFILTAGEADLILCDAGDVPQNAYVLPMKHNVAYNIPDYGWHHVVMSKDAHIILFERTETSAATSDYAKLTQAQLNTIHEQLRPFLKS